VSQKKLDPSNHQENTIMYEFIKTPTGWRVYWGIDPVAKEEQTLQIMSNDGEDEPVILSFAESLQRSAA
jgi:hypothetical protein